MNPMRNKKEFYKKVSNEKKFRENMDCNSVNNTEEPDVLCTLMSWSSKLPFAQWKSLSRLPCTPARYRKEKAVNCKKTSQAYVEYIPIHGDFNIVILKGVLDISIRLLCKI